MNAARLVQSASSVSHPCEQGASLFLVRSADPVALTADPVALTACPVALTACPVALTACPVALTACPAFPPVDLDEAAFHDPVASLDEAADPILSADPAEAASLDDDAPDPGWIRPDDRRIVRYFQFCTEQMPACLLHAAELEHKLCKGINQDLKGDSAGD